jgi:hypothetical protein
MSSDKTEQLKKRTELTKKLLALYDSNKGYIDKAEKFLSPSSQKEFESCRKENLEREDIDRLYAHVFVLEHLAKLLYEEFVVHKKE